jgi:hypothetical protein
MVKFSKSKKENRMSWKASTGFFMLLLYCLQFFSTEFLHDLLHQHPEAEVVHSTNLEKDPCHLSIYHPEKGDGCEHKSHITKKIKCSFTHPSVVSKHLA